MEVPTVKEIEEFCHHNKDVVIVFTKNNAVSEFKRDGKVIFNPKNEEGTMVTLKTLGCIPCNELEKLEEKVAHYTLYFTTGGKLACIEYSSHYHYLPLVEATVKPLDESLGYDTLDWDALYAEYFGISGYLNGGLYKLSQLPKLPSNLGIPTFLVTLVLYLLSNIFFGFSKAPTEEVVGFFTLTSLFSYSSLKGVTVLQRVLYNVSLSIASRDTPGINFILLKKILSKKVAETTEKIKGARETVRKIKSLKESAEGVNKSLFEESEIKEKELVRDLNDMIFYRVQLEEVSVKATNKLEELQSLIEERAEEDRKYEALIEKREEVDELFGSSDKLMEDWAEYKERTSEILRVAISTAESELLEYKDYSAAYLEMTTES